MDIIELVKQKVIDLCDEYKNSSEDKYDFWNEHIKYVYQESEKLAIQYKANLEIVLLGSLLHDIALISKVGDRKDHHINGKILADKILSEYDYPLDKKEKVLNCVYNHRSSKNGTTIEEICVADADILAHFDNILMIFNSVFRKNNSNLNEIRNSLRGFLEKDFNDLSENTKSNFQEKYNLIYNLLL